MIYTTKDIAVIRDSGKRLAEALRVVVDAVRPGVSSIELDAVAEREIRARGGEPSFLGYRGTFAKTGFPSTLCVSINDELVHGPATPARDLRAGDIVGLDIGMRYPSSGGFCTDMAVTVMVGSVSAEAARLVRVTEESLQRGIAAAVPGAKMRDVSRAIQSYVEAEGFSVVRDLIGHGVGKNVHEEPEVPNFVVKGPIGDYVLKPGLVIAIEPMVAAGHPSVDTLEDGWTVRMQDRSLAAHFEHTIMITKDGPEIVTLV